MFVTITLKVGDGLLNYKYHHMVTRLELEHAILHYQTNFHGHENTLSFSSWSRCRTFLSMHVDIVGEGWADV